MGIGGVEHLECRAEMKKQPIKIDQQYYENAWGQWDDMKSLGPASRHVRRLILSMIKDLDFVTFLDAGCGVGTLLMDIHHHYPQVDLNGAEFSQKGTELARQKNPYAKIHQLDLTQKALPQKFDLVTCVDVLEHIEDDQSALENLHQMTAKYLLLVVPTGPLFEQERIHVGHVHGYSHDEVKQKLQKAGYQVIKEMAWGFPLYTIYRRLIMNVPEEAVGGHFDWKKKLVSEITYLILFINLPFWGDRYYVLCQP
jgi:trans-aconitate methyltransferase